jgi:DNA-directed RNA polymerase specialized sigma24 family protein
MGCREGTVRAHLARAREALASRLEISDEHSVSRLEENG